MRAGWRAVQLYVPLTLRFELVTLRTILGQYLQKKTIFAMVGVPQGKSLSSPGADRRSFQGSRGCSQSSCSLSSRSSFLEPSHPQIPQAKNPCLAFHLEQAKRRRVDG